MLIFWSNFRIFLFVVFLFVSIGGSSCSKTLCADCDQLQLQLKAPKDKLKNYLPKSDLNAVWGTLELSFSSESNSWEIAVSDLNDSKQFQFDTRSNLYNFSSVENNDRQVKVSLSATPKNDNKIIAEIHCMKVVMTLTGKDFQKILSEDGLKIRLLDKKKAYLINNKPFLKISGTLSQMNSCKYGFILDNTSKGSYFYNASESKLTTVEGSAWKTCKDIEKSKAKANRCLNLKDFPMRDNW